MLKVSLTHDVDRTCKTYQCLTHGLKSLSKGNMRKTLYHTTSLAKRKDVYWNFEDIIEIEEKYGIKSTFFFLVESFPFKLLKPSSWKLSLGRYDINEKRITDIIQRLDNNGWEIGLHGSYTSYNNLELLQKEKNVVESIVGHPISGIRQHYLNLNENTWKYQQKAGFEYDSSWGFTRKIGFKENKITPFKPIGNNFLVFPLAIMDSCYKNTKNRKEELLKIIDLTIANDSVLVINWHSNNFNEKEFPGYKDVYVEIIEVCKEYNAVFDTLNNFLN